MADTEAKITLSAQDNASPVIQQAAQNFQNLRGTLVDIGPYMDGTYKNFDALGNVVPEATSAVGGFNLGMVGSIAAGMGLATTLASVVSGLKDFAVAALDAGSQMQIIQTKAEVLFGSDLPGMSTAISDMATELHRSTLEIGGFVTSADMFATSMGMGKDQAEQLSLGMADLAVKIGQATGTDEQQGFAQLERGLRGYGRALVDVGIDLNAHRLQEYMDAQGIHEKYTALDDASKALVAYHYLLTQEGTIDAMAAKNQGGYAEQTKRLGAAWQDLETTLGRVSVGPATFAIEQLSEAVKGFEILTLGATEVWNDFLGKSNSANNAEFGQIMGVNPKDMKPQVEGPFLGDSQMAALKSQEAWTASLKTLPDVAGGAGKAVEKLKTEVDALNTRYDDSSRNITNKLAELDNAHQNRMQSMEASMERDKESLQSLNDTYAEQVGNIKESLQNLKDSFAQTMDDITAKEEDAVGKQENKLQTLKDKLDQLALRKQQEDRRGSVSVQTNDEIEKTQKEYDQEKQALDAYKASGALTPDQLSAADAYAGKTDFQRQIDSINAEKSKATTKYNKDTGKLTDQETDLDANHAKKVKQVQDEQKMLQGKMVLEQAAYGLERTQLIETQTALLGLHDTMTTALADMAKVTKKNVDDMIADLKRLATATNSATFQMQAKSMVQNGAASGVTRIIQLQQQGSQ
jgi:hypothetical protein